MKTSKSHSGFSLFFPVWLCFNATARLCSEWGLWGGLGLGAWEIVRNSRGMYLVLWLFGPYQYPFLGLGFISIFWTCTWFCWCKYFPACIHHLSLSAWSRSILVDELRAELSSASAHMCWKLCGRLLPICFAIPGYPSNLCTVCSPRCTEPATFQKEGAKWKPVFQPLEQRWLLAILLTLPLRLIACTTACSIRL